mmetsp:Transcript_12991/g.26877  ORF Transcript_12991/g.26877 Transcript_12991/m.26877 type:complete len:212 (+) Transcript_12991:831-1466(+)
MRARHWDHVRLGQINPLGPCRIDGNLPQQIDRIRILSQIVVHVTARCKPRLLVVVNKMKVDVTANLLSSVIPELCNSLHILTPFKAKPNVNYRTYRSPPRLGDILEIMKSLWSQLRAESYQPRAVPEPGAEVQFSPGVAKYLVAVYLNDMLLRHLNIILDISHSNILPTIVQNQKQRLCLTLISPRYGYCCSSCAVEGCYILTKRPMIIAP